MSEVPLVVKAGPGHVVDDNTFTLRISPEHAEEVVSALREEGFEPSAAGEYFAGTDLALFTLAFTQAGGLDGLAAVLTTIFARHDNKRLVVRIPGNVEVEADGYSGRKLRTTLGAAAEFVKEMEVEWGRVAGAETTPDRQLEEKGNGDDPLAPAQGSAPTQTSKHDGSGAREGAQPVNSTDAVRLSARHWS